MTKVLSGNGISCYEKQCRQAGHRQCRLPRGAGQLETTAIGCVRCSDKLNLDIGRIVNSDDSTEIPQLETSIRYVVGESDCLVQDEQEGDALIGLD